MLYGDGKHDDTQAIQALLDTHKGLVELPMPEKCYLISAPLKIHSYQELRLPRYCHMRLADGCNRHMLVNADMEDGNSHITVSGGIWDFNNLGQGKNPQVFEHFDLPGCNDRCFLGGSYKGVYGQGKYDGLGMLFYNVQHLVLQNLTLKDPVTFGCTLDRASYFTVENIEFDYNLGNPYPVNMDGIHLNGNCHFGTIRNLHGATYDDLVALNAEEGSCGPISHILIDGLFAERCQSFIRLLTASQAVTNIHISNLYGTSFLYGVGVTNYYYDRTSPSGYFDGLVFSNIHIAKGEPVIHPDYGRCGLDTFGLISVDRDTVTRSLHISDLYRTEHVLPTPTLEIQRNARLHNLVLENCRSSGELEFPFVKNDGQVDRLTMNNVYHDSGEFWTGNAAAAEKNL